MQKLNGKTIFSDIDLVGLVFICQAIKILKLHTNN
jgi:hypothetical protein